MAKAQALLKAYMGNDLPLNGGFIVSAFFDDNSIYSIYEVTAYKNVKDIFSSPEGLTFKTDGNRTHALIEPPTYSKRFTDPVYRENGRAIPYRFKDLEIITTKKQERIMVPHEPIPLYSSFTILKSMGDNFSYIFYPSEDVYMAIKKFLADSFHNDAGITKDNSAEAAQNVINTIKKFTIWS